MLRWPRHPPAYQGLRHSAAARSLPARPPQPGYNLALSLPESDRFFDDKIDILESNQVAQSASYE